jgi:hypothetical protein
LLPAAAGLAVVLCLAVYLVRLDRVVGQVVDDAWYLLLAKALASGQGYTLINSPSPGIRPFYPPLFPFLLSLLLRISPDFPGNLWLLKSVSVMAMLGVGFLSYVYAHAVRGLERWTAFGLALATVLTPALVFLATSTVMSECVFMLLQLASIVAVERCARAGREPRAWRLAALAGLLAGAALLTRSAGVGLPVAVVAYLAKERLTRSAAICGVLILLVAGPFAIASRSFAPTPQQKAEQGANIVQTYQEQFFQRVAGQPLKGLITWQDLPARVGFNLSQIGVQGMGGFAFHPLYFGIEPGDRIPLTPRTQALSLALTLMALLGFLSVALRKMTVAEIVVPLSVAVTLSWGWEQFRLLLPLVPLLLFYLVMGLETVARLVGRLFSHEAPTTTRPGGIVTTLFVFGVALSSLYGNVQYIERKRDPDPAHRVRWIRAFEENEALMRYVDTSLPANAVIAAQNPALLHLYTGRKTVSSDDPEGQWETWKTLGVRYLANTSPFPLSEPGPSERKFRTIYRPGGTLDLRIVDLGEVSSRPEWSGP